MFYMCNFFLKTLGEKVTTTIRQDRSHTQDSCQKQGMKKALLYIIEKKLFSLHTLNVFCFFWKTNWKYWKHKKQHKKLNLFQMGICMQKKNHLQALVRDICLRFHFPIVLIVFFISHLLTTAWNKMHLAITSTKTQVNWKLSASNCSLWLAIPYKTSLLLINFETMKE